MDLSQRHQKEDVEAIFRFSDERPTFVNMKGHDYITPSQTKYEVKCREDKSFYMRHIVYEICHEHDDGRYTDGSCAYIDANIYVYYWVKDGKPMNPFLFMSWKELQRLIDTNPQCGKVRFTRKNNETYTTYFIAVEVSLIPKSIYTEVCIGDSNTLEDIINTSPH